jgi:hypothetical protein
MLCKHTYHSRLISEGVAEAFQIFLPDASFYQNDIALRNTLDVTGGKTVAIWLLSISGGNLLIF